MIQRTLVLVKPDGVRRGLIGDVLTRIERKGLQVVVMDLRTIDAGLAETHYAEHIGKPFFEPLVAVHHFRPAGRPGRAGATGHRSVPRAGRRHRSGAGRGGHYPR